MPNASPSYDNLPTPLGASRLIVNIVALCSIAIFAALASKVVPAALGLITVTEPREIPAVPLLLSVALIFLVWRRSIELQKAERDRSEAAKREHELAYKDDVTGLFNRRFLVERLSSANLEIPSTLLIIDIDHFKKVNDLYGHAAGDCLLLEIARRMATSAPQGAHCVRLGGDEFAILLSGDGAQPEQASKFAQQLIAQLNHPVDLEASVTRIGASIGLATIESGQGDAVSLLRRGDIAMYEAKRLGRNCCVWFDAEMERQLNQRNQLEADIRTSIIEGRFIPYFQPMLELSSGQVNGFEVLARWDHPTRGIVEPDEFIPVAEATGMIADLSFSVMRTALLRAVQWPGDVTIAVNVSPVQFKDPLLAQRIMKLLHETGFPARRLELEITESAILEDKGLAVSTIESLKNFGVRLSLDDFGTGYASLSQLRELPFDRIKIDRSFVATLMDDKQSSAIIHAIATLGKSLNLPITAEGVETENINQRLQELGCSDAQGWLFGKAIPGQEAGTTFFGLPSDTLPKAAVERIARPSQDRRNYRRRGAG